MVFGYARVSKDDQNLNLQIDALQKYGVDELYEEKISGAKQSRPQLDELLSKLRVNDTLVVWRLDRLGRTVKQLLALAERFQAKKINLVSLTENFDTTTAMGKACFNIWCVLAQMERDVISERTKSGLESARKRGVKGGRKAHSKKDVDTAMKMYFSNNFSIPEIIKATGICRTSLYKYVSIYKTEEGRSKQNGEK